MMSPNKFEVTYKNAPIIVEVLSVAGQTLYRVNLKTGPPLILTRATHANAYKFWTSIPEGRQTEAEEVGPLIAEYIRASQK